MFKSLAKKIHQLIFPHAIISYAQSGEDILLWHFFRNQKKGFYIDIGAHHPRRFSNTKLLYDQGWSGLNIDPRPKMQELFHERTRDINLNIGISDKAGTIKYYMFAKEALNTCDQDVAKQQIKDSFKQTGVINVPVYTLAEIVDKYCPNNKIDFLSIDVEGYELKVLEGHDWAKYEPTIIAIEDHQFNLETPEISPVYRFLKNKNYTLIDKTNYTIFYKKI